MTDFEAMNDRNVVVRDGNQVRIRQADMRPGRPYGFVLDGVPVVAIKRADEETVDFYYIDD